MRFGINEDKAANDEKTKKEEDFRIYDDKATDRVQVRVREHYHKQHKNQTVQFVRHMHNKWLGFTHAEMPVLDCLQLLSDWIDESDPDTDDANLLHAYQTAERLRLAYPDRPWLHLTGLVHDLGKVMSVWGEEQWAVTGDTYPVGCKPAKSIVYGLDSFDGNEDNGNPLYRKEIGMYAEGCGIGNLLMTWGHDEYLYQVLRNHGTTLPDEALYAIRFHSFYPYHTGGDYKIFESDWDRQMHPAIMQLNSCDLYSKSDKTPDVEALKEYYQSLIDVYIPGVVRW